VVAAREPEFSGVLFRVLPPRHIERMAVGPILVERRQILEQRNLAAHRRADRIHQVPADLAARIAEPIRMLRALRVEQNARRLAGAGRQDHDPGRGVPLLAAETVDVIDAVRSAVGPQGHLVHHRIRDDVEVPGLEGRRQVHGG
jgi:hypothetical protein